MSNRRGANRIRGPQSALTDFLAANNISAQQIRDEYQRRRQNAEADAAAEAADGNGDDDGDFDEEEQAAREAAIAKGKKRKREVQDEIKKKVKLSKGKGKDKGKGADKRKGKGKGKAKGKAKGRKNTGDSDDEEEESDFDAESDVSAEFGGYKKAVKLPGQLEHCELCGKRFTVTTYSKSGPDGGLLCTPCGKEIAKEADKAKKADAKKAGPAGRKRRKIESDRLDGRVTLGAKSLQQLCLEKASQYAGDVEDLGDLPQRMVERLAEIFTKKRVMKSNTLPLFLQPDAERIAIHDCAYLDSDNFIQMLSTCPSLHTIILGNACQFNSRSMDYMSEKTTSLRWLHLYAANLITNETWSNFIRHRGPQLECLQLTDLDTFFEDDHISGLVTHCPNLERLKLKRCRRLTPDCLLDIAKLKSLKHLSLRFSAGVSVPNDTTIELLQSIGPHLQTLSLEDFYDADDAVLDVLGSSCTRLRKLRLAANDTITDAAWSSLFTTWSANRVPPLRNIDLSRTRDIDNSNPDGPLDFPIGIGATAFPALMAHSASELRYLSLASCRHIPLSALYAAFPGSSSTQYPELLEVDFSFVSSVDTVVLAGLFRSAPNLRKVVAFGCFAVEALVVPAGVVVIGVPKAQDAIERFGAAGVDVEGALGGMLGSVEVGVAA